MGRLGQVLIIAVLLCFQLGSGSSRVLQSKEEELMKKMNNVRLEALPRGDVPPSGPSGCTYIPGSGGSGCPINQRNFAGGSLPRASAYPQPTASFGVATNQK